MADFNAVNRGVYTLPHQELAESGDPHVGTGETEYCHGVTSADPELGPVWKPV